MPNHNSNPNSNHYLLNVCTSAIPHLRTSAFYQWPTLDTTTAVLEAKILPERYAANGPILIYTVVHKKSATFFDNSGKY